MASQSFRGALLLSGFTGDLIAAEIRASLIGPNGPHQEVTRHTFGRGRAAADPE
jgi:hypothetical protein